MGDSAMAPQPLGTETHVQWLEGERVLGAAQLFPHPIIFH